ncbi:MAG: FUN14 domain-containing protein [Candidatus Bathyarchaeia archaeon]
MDNGTLATLIATQIGLGGTLGFLLGYGLKKVATVLLKIMALVSALFMLGVTWLASTGIITVNLNAFTTTVGNSFSGAMTALGGSFALLAQAFPIGGSFGVGFYIGARKG